MQMLINYIFYTELTVIMYLIKTTAVVECNMYHGSKRLHFIYRKDTMEI